MATCDTETFGSLKELDLPKVRQYRLRRWIARGGMGEVWEAVQSDLNRRVAIKFVKADREGVLNRRFRIEQSALARMDHPNIAQVYDAGISESGRPFLVMELVEGETLDLMGFCDRNRLDIPSRLNLFQDICRAVQHAHTKSIAHRDLKPSNILVATVDENPFIKIIDFGLAKSLEVDDHSLASQGQIVGTPTYMSPEQTGQTSRDIDNRTDIYTLGVILFELLVGSTPVRRSDLLGLNDIQKLRRIPELPSPSLRGRFSEFSVDEQNALAKERSTTRKSLERLLKGDLEWLVEHALNKEPDDRYETANEFADEVARFARNDALRVAKPSIPRLYRLRKYVMRHKALTAALAAGLGVFVVIVLGYYLAAKAREDYKNLSQAFVGSFRIHADKGGVQPNMSINEVLSQINSQLENSVENYELPSKSTYLWEVARNYRVIGDLDAAANTLQRAIDACQDETERAQLLRDLGTIKIEMGNTIQGNELVNRSGVVDSGSIDDRRIRRGQLARLEAEQPGGFYTAIEEFEALIEEVNNDPNSDKSFLTQWRHSLANCYGKIGDYANAFRVFKQLLTDVPVENLLRANVLSDLGYFQYRTGNFEESRKVLLESLAIRESYMGEEPEVFYRLGPKSPLVTDMLNNLRLLALAEKKCDPHIEALKHFQKYTDALIMLDPQKQDQETIKALQFLKQFERDAVVSGLQLDESN